MKKTAVSLALALMLLVSICLTVSAAETLPEPIDTTNIVQLDDLTAPEPAQEDTPSVPGEPTAQPGPEETEEGAAPAEPKAPESDSGNTPYMIGAAIALLVFIGVAFYCKHHGDKTL